MEWPLPPDALSLAAADVHVWRVALDDEPPAAARAALSARDAERAAAFRFPHLTARFVAAHAALRAILSRYTGVAAADLRFVATPRGKPSLGPGPWPAFNLSHSRDVALVAVTAGRDVGVDLEWIADRPRFDRLDRFFSPAECDQLRDLHPAARLHAAYACWTRKEAFLKARGDGLGIPLDSFDVACAPGDAPRVLAVRAPAADGRVWMMFEVAPGGPFAGAVVAEGDGLQLRQWRWTWR